jgi:SAM-dependent methyltransferase
MALPLASTVSPGGYYLVVNRKLALKWMLIAVLAAVTIDRQSPQASQGRSLAPYVPTPSEVVDRMLTLAMVGPRDVVYDLGCGDGRIVIAAAQKFGARGVGVDIDANLINRAEANAKAAGVDRRVKFLVQDAMTVDVSDATVVTLYLLSSSNVKLRPILTRQLRRGARIVSHSFAMGDWEPEVVDTFRDANGTSRTLYLWTTDGKTRQ